MPSTPSNEEQLLLELINRFRANPAEEAALLTGSGIPSDIAGAINYFGVSVSAFTAQLAGLSPVAPLAWNGKLADAADGHNAAMIANDQQAHQLPGEPDVGVRATNAGYTTYTNLGENVYLYAEDPLYAHAAFIIDWGYDTEDFDGSTLRNDYRTRGDGIQDPPGHRVNLINGTYTEIGVSMVAEDNPATAAGPFSVTQDLGARFDYQAQFVGVVINDVDHDHFYDIGEGLGGVTVTLQRGANTYTTTTWSSGGYEIAVPAGTYTITFSGGRLAAPVIKTATLGTSNVEVVAEAGAVLINYVDQRIATAYLTYGGRAPTSDELAAWEGVIGASRNYDLVKNAILSTSLGHYYVDQQITAAYQTYGGRAPTSAELAAWEGAIGGSQNYTMVKNAILSTSLGRFYVDQQITAAYQTYGGRTPTSAEIAAWEGAIGASQNYDMVKNAILSTSLGHYYVDQQITAAYQTYGGRAPTSAELAAWEGAIGGSQNYDVVKNAILSTSLGHYFVDQQISAAYRTYGGRAPTSDELAAWEGAIGASQNYSVVKNAILSTSLGQAYVDAQITAAYQTYGGRAPVGNELQVWEGVVNGNGHDFSIVRGAILSTSLGQAYTDAQITTIYQTYGGRAPIGNELQVWESVLSGNNHDFSVLRNAILSTSLGDDNSTAQIDALYQRYFGRAANAEEQAAWHGVIRGGIDFDALRDVLMSDSGSAASTQQLSGTNAADTFHFAGTPYLTISGFDPAHDVIDVRGLGYSSINPLDAVYARQIHAIDGTPDVLITLDASHEILLHNVSLSQLGSADFLL